MLFAFRGLRLKWRYFYSSLKHLKVTIHVFKDWIQFMLKRRNFYSSLDQLKFTIHVVKDWTQFLDVRIFSQLFKGKISCLLDLLALRIDWWDIILVLASFRLVSDFLGLQNCVLN